MRKKEARTFSVQDGLPWLEFNYNASCADSVGNIYFGGLKGLLFFNSTRVNKNEMPVNPYVSKISLDYKEVDFLKLQTGKTKINAPAFLVDTFDLDYSVSVLTLELRTDDYISPHRQEFRYKLEGFDDKYTYVTSENRNVTYTHLKGGTYFFKYSCRSIGGSWSNEKLIVIIKHVPFWKEKWFVATVLIIVVFVLGVILVFFLKAQAKRRQQLEEKITERTKLIAKQKENLLHQRDALITKNKKILKQQEVLKESNEQVNYQNEELRSQSDMLHEVNQEMMQQNKMIADQAQKLKEKNSLLSRGLNYAKRIQISLFPDENDLKRHIHKSFIFFKPKEKVSGDFLWLRKVANKIIIAEVDCTGHGVPGAFMSMIGNALLNEIVGNKHITDPATIFYHLNEELHSIFKQGDYDIEAQDEGMDLSLCTIDLSAKKVVFASAMQNVFIARPNCDIEVVKGDIFSIGGLMSKFKKPIYTNFEFAIEPGMRLIFTSDGYIDQFGGAERGKFGVERFERLLCNNSSNSMEGFKKSVEESFTNWLGDNDQLDDILVVAIEF
ncbi:MAG: SpoIIE family protein phosphatase [Bacteroidales bacterium]|nr:SpoIIE family protein phosphatase [Bacteroidales bacterium]